MGALRSSRGVGRGWQHVDRFAALIATLMLSATGCAGLDSFGQILKTTAAVAEVTVKTAEAVAAVAQVFGAVGDGAAVGRAVAQQSLYAQALHDTAVRGDCVMVTQMMGLAATGGTLVPVLDQLADDPAIAACAPWQ